MSKRNLKLLAALVVILLAVVLSYFYLGDKPTSTNTEDSASGDNFFADLLNFGTNSNSNTKNDTENPSNVSGYVPPATSGTEVPKMQLIKISSMPIAGYSLFNQERYVDVAPPIKTAPEEGDEIKAPVILEKPVAPSTESIPVLRYVAKENGNIFQTFIDKINERKFSDTLIPGVHEAFFGNNGESVVMRYLKTDNSTIATWSGVLPKETLGSDSTQSNKLTGSYLVDNITDLSISPDTNKIFYLFNSKDGAVGITSTPLGDKKTQVYNGAYTEWLSQYPNDELVTLTTKPSSLVPGFMYAIDINKKDLRRVLGKINGLTTLMSPNTNFVLYSNNNLSLSLYNTNTKETKEISMKTLAEKCAWGRGSEFVYCFVPKYVNTTYSYPDSWYQGEVSFSDDIWRINTTDGNAELVLDTSTISNASKSIIESIDGIKPSLSNDGKFLFFVNKKDSYLWGIELE